MDRTALLSRLPFGRGCLASILNARGDTLIGLGQPAEALASYERALQLLPRRAATCYKRGNALLALGRPADAAVSYGDAVRLRPAFVDALYNRGLALQVLNRPADALADFDAVLQSNPDDADALNNRGNTLLTLKRPADALADFDRALALTPRSTPALHNRGLALVDLKRPADAASSFAALMAIAPGYPFAKGKLLHAKMMGCDWTDLEASAEDLAQDVRAGRQSAEPFGYLAISSSAEDQQSCATTYAAAYYRPSPAPLRHSRPESRGKLRIGYVSGEFRAQATAFLITELLELHDKQRFEIIGFDNGWDDGSDVRKRINGAFHEIVSIAGLSDHEAATMIAQKKVDLLINLNGYFGLERQGIFSLRPSPLQINFLGFPGTLGASCMDYIIADREVIPEDQQNFYVEKIVYLPDSYQVNDRQRRISTREVTRADAGLPERAFVFCCFNNNYKITPDVFAAWMGLLDKIAGSVLWLLEDNADAARNLRNAAARRGIAPERLVFAPKIPADEHLARHRLADLFLDTLPCNAHTTASDALWTGLPLITCRGTTFTGRVASSLLNAIGAPELITGSLDEYAALAVKLATAPAELAAIRDKLLRNRSTHPLFDTDRYRRHIESAYVTLWEKHVRGESPASFAVAAINQVQPAVRNER